MTRTVTMTASEANRNFSAVLRAVSQGARVRVTSHGRPVAVVSSPTGDADSETRRAAAFAELKRHLAKVEHVTVGSWTRDDLNQR